MRRLAGSRSGIARYLIAVLCIACTGTFTAVRGAVRPDALAGPGWMDAAPDRHLAPARTPTVIGLLGEGRRADARNDTKRFGFGGPPWTTAPFVVASRTMAARIEPSRRATPTRPENRAPYHATAPPTLP